MAEPTTKPSKQNTSETKIDNKFGIISFVCGLTSLLLIPILIISIQLLEFTPQSIKSFMNGMYTPLLISVITITAILNILAIVFFFKQKKVKTTKLAIAGLILGIIPILLIILTMILTITLLLFNQEHEGLGSEKCVANPPFSCMEYKLIVNNAIITIQNNGYVNISNVNIKMSCDGKNFMTPNQPSKINTMNVGDKILYQFNTSLISCGKQAVGQKLKAQFNITYTNPNEIIVRTSSGSIQARIEE